MATLIVALDVPTTANALALVDRLGDRVDFYKIGAPLFTHDGPGILAELRDRGKRIFLDLKFHDIPNTVARSVEAAAKAGVDLLTLHTAGGSAMLRAARQAVGDDGPRLLAVTILTSLSAAGVEEVWAKELRSLREEVARLAGLAADSGAHGVVASAQEAEALKRRHGAEFLVVTPGIRPPGAAHEDHARPATPAEAASAGADYIVVGRPVIKAEDPVGVVDDILRDLNQVSGSVR
ncbi:MAG TPA: orotidine-5'-phosphate decarboxylase [Longimicrobiales bacterium]|nr:orotidine-5'-phosphate decarboxylase [Longimicrobiales bacterium]